MQSEQGYANRRISQSHKKFETILLSKSVIMFFIIIIVRKIINSTGQNRAEYLFVFIALQFNLTLTYQFSSQSIMTVK